MKTADLQPPLGVNGGPCKVVERINQRVRDPDDRRDLIRQLLRGHGLDNNDAMMIYSLEPEKLKGMPFVLGPHLQYRMDHRGITIDQVRSGLLNYYEAAKAGTAPKVTRDTKTTWLDPSGLEMSIGVSAARGVLMVITAYWKGKPDPRVPAEGCGTMKVADATKEHADTARVASKSLGTRTASMSEMKSFMEKFVNGLPNPENNDLQWEVDYRINYEKFLDPVFAGSRKRDALGFVSAVTGKPHCVVTITFRSQVELPRHIQGYGFIETEAVMDPNGYVRVVETKRVISIPEYQKSLVNWVDKRSKHIQTMLPEAQKAQEKNNLEKAQREEAYRKEKEMQRKVEEPKRPEVAKAPEPPVKVGKPAETELQALVKEITKLVVASNFDARVSSLKDGVHRRNTSSPTQPSWYFTIDYGMRGGGRSSLFYTFDISLTSDGKLQRWGVNGDVTYPVSKEDLYKEIVREMQNVKTTSSGGVDMDSIASSIKSAVRTLRGEGFDVYDTTPNSLSFSFRTWDIPKESEDQDDEIVDSVISKFRKRILSNIGDPNVELYLSLGDKNYLEGEVSVKSPSPTRVASMFLEAGDTKLSRLSPAIRKAVANDIQRKGLDGNGRFTSFGSILNTLDSILKVNGLVMEDSWDLTPRGRDGKFRFPLKWEDGREVSSSMAILTWHKFVETTGNYEAVVYLS